MNTSNAYLACYNEAIFYPLSASGVLRLSGRDRLAFIQRQTTNNINTLTPQQGQMTVLTSAVARIMDVLFAFLDPADGENLFLLPCEGKTTPTGRYLKSRIFFMDQVSLADESSEINQYLVEGPKGREVLDLIGITPPPIIDGVTSQIWRDQKVIIIGWRSMVGLKPAYRILAPVNVADQIEQALAHAGAQRMDPAVREIIRIEAGIAASGKELSEDYTPLEVGLGYAVADNKGCYTGQEIIARQITYDKVTRQLVGLRLSQPAKAGNEVVCEDKPAGIITSSAVSPRYGPLALAVLKRPFFTPGTPVSVQSDGQTLDSEVTTLPFVDQSA